MSGENKSVKDKFEEIENYLNKYEENLGLNSKKYLVLTDEQISRLMPCELDEYSADLANFGVFLQKEINKQTSKITFADSNIKRIVALEGNNYKTWSYEERKNLVIQGNESAKEYEKFRVYSQMKLDRLAYLPTKLSILGDKLERMANGKRSKNYG